MLVYGDADETIRPRLAIERLRAASARIATQSPGMKPHAALGALFIEAAALAQGLTDALFEARGHHDADSPAASAALHMVMQAAQDFVRSWRGQAHIAGAFAAAADALVNLDLPAQITIRRAEGYAFYALYPETYVEAAASLAGYTTTVIGIRSIGLGLAALVAAASGNAAPLTVRPMGPPFARHLALSPGCDAYLHNRPAGEQFAVVDEGPGLSGSSFGAVLDRLARLQVDESRIHVFPSHAGAPGYAAPAEAQARWRRLSRHVVDFDALFLDPAAPARHLENWFIDVVGPPTEPLRDLSGGAWRELGPWPGRSPLPPSNVQQERRKFLLRTEGGSFLLKFVGLGRHGDEAFARARILSAEGFIPDVLGFRHGFLLERWQSAPPPDANGEKRPALLDHLAAYLAFRRQALATPGAPGASLPALAAMLRQNGREALGNGAGAGLDRLAKVPPGLQLQRVATDNRLQPWEWIETADGRLLKTDAIDHCAAHDLIGHQDIAWDIAGASIEFGLSSDERQRLVAAIESASGHPVDRRLLRFLLPCYLAFQLGACSMAADALSGLPEEQHRLRARAAFYRDRLSALL